MPKQLDDKRTAAASYILEFYNEVQLLKHETAQYINLLVEFDGKYNIKRTGKDNLDGLGANDTEIATFMQQLQKVRYYVIKSYISYKSITKKLGLANEINQKDYDVIESKFIIPEKELKNFVESMVYFFVGDIIKSLLESAESIIQDVFGEQQQNANP